MGVIVGGGIVGCGVEVAVKTGIVVGDEAGIDNVAWLIVGFSPS